MSLFVNELFLSIQGEGRFAGTPALFVRLQGCELRCPFCDTAHALDLDPGLRLEDESPLLLSKPSGDPRFALASEDWLVRAALADPRPIRHLVLTGGEPFLQKPLLFMLLMEERGFFVQVETSGASPLVCTARSWITLSPKRRRPPLEESWERADEVKLAVEGEAELELFGPRLEALPPERVRLQPVSLDPEATRLCVRTCMERNWRLSLQTHKFVDLR